jgi:D-aspartate ligase
MSQTFSAAEPQVSQRETIHSGARRLRDATPSAVVVGGDANGLGIIRSLARGKVQVIVADVGMVYPAMHSRFAHSVIIRKRTGAALVEDLIALRVGLGEYPPVLFLTDDLMVRTVSAFREHLEAAYRLRLPSHGRVCELLHKVGFQRLAEEHGFPVPHSVAVSNDADCAELGTLRFPAVIKPGTKEFVEEGKAPRAYKVFSREEAESICRRVLPTAPDLIVQEWVAGSDSDIYFCLQYRGANGVVVGSFTGRKLCCWPPSTGSTASCMAAPETAAVLEPLTSSFFDKVGLVGMCSMEFKRDPITHCFTMIEPTIGRTDWQEEIATLCGVNIPLAAYCYEVGLPVPQASLAVAPIVWRDPLPYWRGMLAKRSLRDWNLSNARLMSAYWRLDDPLPSIFNICEWLSRRLRRSRGTTGSFDRGLSLSRGRWRGFRPM